MPELGICGAHFEPRHLFHRLSGCSGQGGHLEWARGLQDYYGADVGELTFLHEHVEEPLAEEAAFHREHHVRNQTRPRDIHGAAILSGLLRRAHIFSAAGRMNFVDLWWNWSGSELLINLEWAGDLTHGQVIDRVLHPVFGLPFTLADRGDCLCDPCMLAGYSVDLVDTVMGCVTLALRRSRMYDADKVVRPTCTGEIALSQRRRARWTRSPC